MTQQPRRTRRNIEESKMAIVEIVEESIFSFDSNNHARLCIGDHNFSCALKAEDFAKFAEIVNAPSVSRDLHGEENSVSFEDSDNNSFEFYYHIYSCRFRARMFDREAEITSPWFALPRYYRVDV